MEELPVVVVLLLLLSLLLVPLVLLDRRRRGRRTPPFSLLVVAGSGGHTTEILRLLSCLSESYSPRHYVLADSDKMSEAKIRSFEQKRAETFSESQILCNGPGTCVPVCLSAFLLGLQKTFFKAYVQKALPNLLKFLVDLHSSVTFQIEDDHCRPASSMDGSAAQHSGPCSPRPHPAPPSPCSPRPHPAPPGPRHSCFTSP